MNRPHQTVLLIGDQTFPSWSGKKPIPNLGPIGKHRKGQQGFLMHSVLAVRVGRQVHDPVEVLGLAWQNYYVRKPGTRTGEKKADRHSRWRESMIWQEAVRATPPFGDETPGLEWIHVGDRGGDIYEHMLECRAYGHGFVLRANQDRALLDEKGARLFEVVREAPVLGTFEVEVPRRKEQPAGVAHMTLRSTTVELRPPRRGKAKRPLPSQKVTVVVAEESRESATARGAKEALRWVLLTDRGVGNLEEGLVVIGYYVKRWLIEDFHRVLKDVMALEELQLEDGKRLMAAAAIMSVAALRLLDLREHARREPEAKAEKAGLSETETLVLEKTLKRKLETVEEVLYAVARLGGHLKHNGFPGTKTLARGLKRLQELTQGYELAMESGLPSAPP